MGILELRERVDRQLQEQFRRRRPDDPAVNLRKTLVDELIQLDEEGRDVEAAVGRGVSGGCAVDGRRHR